jgi:hypothetical protein
VYRLTLLRKRISAAARPVISRSVVTHVSRWSGYDIIEFHLGVCVAIFSVSCLPNSFSFFVPGLFHVIRRYTRLCLFAYEYFIFLGKVTNPPTKPSIMEDQFVSVRAGLHEASREAR